VWQVAQVAFEGGKTGDRLTIDLEAGHALGDALFGFGDHSEDVATQSAERRALRLAQSAQVLVNLGG
jgi:hypothetical protein